LAGNELMMQKSINLSIQFPNDDSSLLPIHSDVWSGDSPYEINLWLPMVNCYKTKSMYIFRKEKKNTLNKKIYKMKNKSSFHIYKALEKDLTWLKVDYGKFLLFDQSLPHGNVVNKEDQTRVSMNCRFKTIFSPYGDKKIGEFFSPITCRATTEIGLIYNSPF
jgi:sporadic carbohydrate cluster 2OG-Fe(II) oxygenase